MSVECTFNIANAFVTLAGVGLGGVVGFMSARRISDLKSKSDACAKFRAAFAPSLALIYIARHHGSHNKPSVDSEIKKSLLIHGAAVEEFRPFVLRKMKDEYQSAWEKYRKLAVQCPFETAGEEWEWCAKEGELLESNIYALLKFAET